MTDADLIRAVYPSGTLKRLANAMGAPIGTAHTWLHRHISPARRQELAAVLKAELERQEAERAVVLAYIEKILKEK